ncbi:hypothetical protein LIER_31127 [Lithospermum erythrorhizon]|uniref:Uncharacterized protein n=1 Tax=Lithospermum erythrorhizon TaxID=34254 RepID=A0AAV3RRT8_LITER
MKDYEDNAAASPLPPPHTPSGAATASQTNSQILEEMTSVGINADSVNMDHLIIQDQTTCVIESQTENFDNGVVEDDGSNVQVACFSDTVDNATLHFQIIRLQKQVSYKLVVM